MSDPAPEERTYGAGEDIPGTPGPFPYDLAAFACACGSAMLAATMLFVGFGIPFVLPFAPAVAWALFGVIGLTQGKWKGFVIGLPILIAPWAVMFVLIAQAFAPD